MKYIGKIGDYTASIRIKDDDIDIALMYFHDGEKYHEYVFERKIEDHQMKIFEVDDETYDMILEKLS